MRAVIQRVTRASVSIDSKIKSSIGQGLLVLLGIEENDAQDDTGWLSGKIARLRIFDDAEGIMNLSVDDAGGDVLVISQFTLHASTRKGNRPSYIRAAKPDIAVPLYNMFLKQLQQEIKGQVLSGEFGANMQISLVNDGPVTIIIDTKIKE
jgi:D-tyrosyl-tRNA(Tyr) deacylase